MSSLYWNHILMPIPTATYSNMTKIVQVEREKELVCGVWFLHTRLDKMRDGRWRWEEVKILFISWKGFTVVGMLVFKRDNSNCIGWWLRGVVLVEAGSYCSMFGWFFWSWSQIVEHDMVVIWETLIPWSLGMCYFELWFVHHVHAVLISLLFIYKEPPINPQWHHVVFRLTSWILLSVAFSATL